MFSRLEIHPGSRSERFRTSKDWNAPFRGIVQKYPYTEHLEKISPVLSDGQLDIELYKTQRDIEVEHRENGSKVQSLSLEDPTEYEEYKELYDQCVEEENELGKAMLAKYCVQLNIGTKSFIQFSITF